MNSFLKLVCILAFVLGIFTGCSSEHSYQALVCSFSDSGTGVSHTYEYSFWQEPIDESNVRQNITMDIDGKVISGKYDYSYRISPNNYSEYTYTDSEDNRFTVDENGRLTRFSRGGSSRNSPDQSTENAETQEKCLKIATDFLSKYINTDNYQFSQADHSASSQYYSFDFQKYIGGFPTSDGGNITISSSGELESFNFFMLGEIPTDTRLSFDIEQVKECITQKLDLLYSEQHNKYNRIEYEFHDDEFIITILENGQVAMICNVSVSFYLPLNDENIVLGERVGFVVTKESLS